MSLLHHPGLERWEEFTCLNSLREVEPSVKLILDDGGLDEELTTETQRHREEEEQAADTG